MARIALLLFIAYWIPTLANARDREFTLFAGGGLSMASMNVSGVNTAASNFRTHGYLFEGGMDVPIGDKWGATFTGVMGQLSAVNSLQSETYMETGKLDYYAAKAGIYVGPVTVGGGFRKNTLNIKSISLDTDSYTESTYEGNTPFVYGGLTVFLGKSYRASVEGTYMETSLKSTLGAEAKYKEMSISARIYILFFE